MLLSGLFVQEFRLRRRLTFIFCSYACPGGPKKQKLPGAREDLNPALGNRKCIKFVLHQNLLNNTQGLTFLSRNLYGRYPQDVKFQNSEWFSVFLDPNIVRGKWGRMRHGAKWNIRFIFEWNIFQNMFYQKIKRLFHFAPCFIHPHFPLLKMASYLF
jgi:hypothetical protein